MASGVAALPPHSGTNAILFGLLTASGVGGLGLALWHYGRRPISVGRLFVGLAAFFFLCTVGAYLAVNLAHGRTLGDIGEDWRTGIAAGFDRYVAMVKEQAGGERLGLTTSFYNIINEYTCSHSIICKEFIFPYIGIATI